MRMVSSQFGSSRGRSGKDGNTYSNHPSRGNTELVTIGGTGGKRSQTGERHFKRLEDELIAEAEESERRRSGGSGGGNKKYGNETTISRSSHSQNNSDDGVMGGGVMRGDGSSDQLPLTSIVVTKDVQWSERNNSTASEWPPGSGNGGGGGYHGHYPGR